MFFLVWEGGEEGEGAGYIHMLVLLLVFTGRVFFNLLLSLCKLVLYG